MRVLEQDVEREIDRMLLQLRNVIRQRGFTQLEVQAQLGWGKSYLSQLLTKQKALRVDQVLQVLNVIAMRPVEFYGPVYHWLEQESEAAGPAAPLEIERELDRVLLLLDNKIRQQGSTQVAIQKRLGWGRSYISQLLSQSKGMRYDQVLSILWVVEVEPSEFFFELYRPGRYHSRVRPPADELAEVRREVAELGSALRRFGRVLVQRGLVADREIPFHLWDTP